MTSDSINDAVTMRPGGGATLGRIDKYDLVRELGEGGFGAVFLAKDTVAGIDVAIKGLPPEVKHNNAELEGIRANFALVKRLRHPNIVAVTDLHLAQSVGYSSPDVEAKLRVFARDTMVVMDYAPGVTLSKWRKQFPDGKVPLDAAISVVRQVASALDYAHGQKVLHRDVKPANVMVETGDDGGLTARVLDFGLAAEIRSSMGRLSREIRDTSGTRPYMAPEQWLGHRQGPATDQYALAVMLYELLVGEVPFASVFDCGDPVVMRLAVTTDAPDIPADLPKGVRRALAKALAKKPEERFASCADFVATLEGKGFSRKGRKGVGKVVGVLALLAVFGVGGYYGWTKYDAHVRAVEAEDARIAAAKNAAEASVKQKVFELVGEASRARDDNAGAEWRDWPHFSVKAKELEESYQGGRTALEGGDYPAASNQFARVCDTWRWLLSNKVERLKAVSSREKAKEGMDAAKKAEAARWNGEGWHAATNLHAQAHEFFDKGDFPSAKNMSDAAVSAFANSLAAANAARTADEKRAKEEKRKKEAERKIAEEKARMEAEAKKKAGVWGECLGLKLEVPAAERAETTRVLVEESRKGWFFNSSFIDYRRADWSNAYILLGLGRFAETKKDGWSPNYPVSLAFYEKSLESGCTNATPAVERIARKLRNKPYFDAIESCDMQRIKALIGKDLPQLTVVDENGNTLMHAAALRANAEVLEYLGSVGYGHKVENGKNGTPPFFCACANTNAAKAISCLEWFLKKGVDVNEPNYKAGEHAPRNAIFHANTLQALNYLLDKGADWRALGPNGDTLLHYAVRSKNDFAMVSRIASLGFDVNAENDNGETPLLSAAGGFSKNRPKILTLLIQKGANVDARAKSGYMKGFQALHLVAYRHCSTEEDRKSARESVNVLVANGADVNARTGSGGLYAGVTPLMQAVISSNVGAVEQLVQFCKADVNLKATDYNKGYKAIHLIADFSSGDQEVKSILDSLLRYGARIDDPVGGENEYKAGHTLLHLLCDKSFGGFNHYRMVKLVLAKRASTSKYTAGGTYAFYSPMGLACRSGSYSSIKALVESGVNLVDCSKNQNGEQALHLVAQLDGKYHDLDMLVSYLVNHGAEINGRLSAEPYGYKQGRTPLHSAVDRSRPDAVSALIKHGASIDATDAKGRTPLWLASCGIADYNRSEKLECIKILLKNGANPNPSDGKRGSLLTDGDLKDATVRKWLTDALADKTKNRVESISPEPGVKPKPPQAPPKVAEPMQTEKPKAKLTPAAMKLVGSWSCRCNVTYHDSLGSRADDLIKSYLPVSSTISLKFSDDGTVSLSDSSGRTFGTARGKWKYRHGMAIMDLKSDDGRTFTLSGTVNWRGDSFELHYDNSEYSNMIRKSCESRIVDLNAVLSSYVDGQLDVSISTKAPNFKSGSARCSPHVFSRQ